MRMSVMQFIRIRLHARTIRVALAGAALPALLAAQGQLQLNAFYTCPAGTRFKVFSCAGTDASSSCDVQTFSGTQSLQRGPSPRAQVLGIMRACHLQTPAEEKALASGAGPAGAPSSSNGINVGDSIEVLTGFGWTPAKVLAIQGNNYRVRTNGVDVTKTYPSEVRRVGAATAQDHAAGQYRLGDRVQVNVNGQWLEGKVVTEMGMDYQVQFGNRTAWAQPKDLRPSTAPPPPAGPAPGTAPKGMTSCAGKIEGRYATTGLGSATIIFRSGKATVSAGLGDDELLECWTAGDKIVLRQPGHPELDMPIDINNDGTLQVPLWGELKKKGN